MDDTLLGDVQDATPATLGFDTDEIVRPEAAQALFADGYRFCLRYVSHGAGEGSNDLTRPEIEGILAAGLALMIVQHVRLAGWTPTAALGTSDGELAVGHARALGCPQGLTLWCDRASRPASRPATSSPMAARGTRPWRPAASRRGCTSAPSR